MRCRLRRRSGPAANRLRICHNGQIQRACSRIRIRPGPLTRTRARRRSGRPPGHQSEIEPDLQFGPEGVTGSARGPDVVLSYGEKAVKGASDLVKITAEDSSRKPADLSLGWEGGSAQT